MSDPVVGPCQYPLCDDGHGEPCLTTQNMCARCRRQYWKRLEWLVLDYVALKTALPSPVRSERGRPSGQGKSFGHPAAWASDTAAEIAHLLNNIEDDLRDQRGDEPPPNRNTVSEARLVVHAWNYLANRFEALCVHPAAIDLADEIVALHSRIRGAMGYRKHFRKLPIRCPGCQELDSLTVGDGEGTDRINCDACGEFIPEERLEFFIRYVAREALDELLDASDAMEAASLAEGIASRHAGSVP